MSVVASWLVDGLWSLDDNFIAQRDHGWYLGVTHTKELCVTPPEKRGYVNLKVYEGDIFHRRARAAIAAHTLNTLLRQGYGTGSVSNGEARRKRPTRRN